MYLSGASVRVQKVKLQGMSSKAQRDTRERTVKIMGGEMSTEIGDQDEAYLLAVEKQQAGGYSSGATTTRSSPTLGGTRPHWPMGPQQWATTTA